MSSHPSWKSEVDQQFTAIDATRAHGDEQVRIQEDIKACQEEEE